MAIHRAHKRRTHECNDLLRAIPSWAMELGGKRFCDLVIVTDGSSIRLKEGVHEIYRQISSVNVDSFRSIPDQLRNRF
jgi:hypothetical protein